MLLGDLPLGARLDVPVISSFNAVFGNYITFIVIDKNHSGYPANSVTLISEFALFTAPYDAKEPVLIRGNGRYKLSNIRQWLNSSAASGNWYAPQHANDMPPTVENSANDIEYASWPGFLSIVSENFYSSLMQTQINAAFGKTGGAVDSVTDKVFLPSAYELGREPANLAVDGSVLSFFVSNDYRAKGTPQNGKPNDYLQYYTRSCDGDADYVYAADVKPDSYYGYPFIGKGFPYFGSYFRPMCNLSVSKELLSSTFAGGHYMLKENPPAAPTINAPASGKRIYNARPRFMITLGAASEAYLRQTITVDGFSKSRDSELHGQKILLRASSDRAPGSVGASITTKTQFSNPSPAASRTTTYELPAYTDNPIQVGVTRIKAVHINELRTMVNNVRSYYGLSAYVWAETIVANQTPTRNWKSHVEELRTAINQIIALVNNWDATNSVNDIPAPQWIAITGKTPRADVMEQIRAVVKTL